MAKVIVSQINPINFVNEDKINLSKYFSYNMDEYLHSIRLNQWQHGIEPFKQIWTPVDVLNLQVITDAGNPRLYILDKCGQSIVFSPLMNPRLQNTEDPTFWMYDIAYLLNLVTLNSNEIFYVRIIAGTLSLLSEPLHFIDDPVNTLLIEYRNRSFYQNMIFEEGFYSAIRVNALLRFKQPAAKDTFYEDQVLDMVMLKSKPFRIFELIIGIQTGVPDFLIDKINRILGCSDLLIDGKYFSKNEEAKWEESDNIGNGALKTYTLELRESTNKTSKIFDTEPEQSGGIFTPEFTFEFQ